MRDLLVKSWGLVVLRGVFAIIFGIMALAWPSITIWALVLLWGAYAVIDGIGALSAGFGARAGSDRWLFILIGVAGLIAGIGSFVWPGVTAVVLLAFIATWAIIIGLLQLVAAWRLRSDIGDWWLLALSGVLSVALGIALLVRPGRGAVAVVIFIGMMAIAWGIVLVGLGFRLRGLGHHKPSHAA